MSLFIGLSLDPCRKRCSMIALGSAITLYPRLVKALVHQIDHRSQIRSRVIPTLERVERMSNERRLFPTFPSSVPVTLFRGFVPASKWRKMRESVEFVDDRSRFRKAGFPFSVWFFDWRPHEGLPSPSLRAPWVSQWGFHSVSWQGSEIAHTKKGNKSCGFAGDVLSRSLAC